MTEVAEVNLPTTISEFVNFSSQLNIVYTITLLYEEFVVPKEEEVE